MHIIIKKIFLINLTFCLLFINPASSETLFGKASVVDGDTIVIEKKKIRLHGIDAPEKKQICKRDYLSISFFTFTKNYQCGLVSKVKLENLLKNNEIKCIIRGSDFYKRKIGTCYRNKININSWMVRNGYAVAYEKYSKKYKSVELEAKKNNLGIWQGDFDMPWDWRKNRVQN
tara:strand:- start:142 stop:660 length:519 start_codon:yes stop_codon:yes gene_type:complete